MDAQVACPARIAWAGDVLGDGHSEKDTLVACTFLFGHRPLGRGCSGNM